MKRLLLLSLCFSLSVFTVARAMKPSHTLATIAKAAEEKPTEAEGNTNEEVVSNDDDRLEDASDDEGRDMSDDDTGDDEGDADNGGGDDGEDGGDQTYSLVL
jgi:hypothetical protein